VTGSTKTRASTTPYTLHITQAAEKAVLTATTALSAATVLDGTNNSFTVGLDGKTSALLTLAPGTYTQTALAQALQSAVNGDTTLNGATINVSVAADLLTFTSNRFGSASQVLLQSGTALAALGFAAGASSQGRDVVGSFTVDGITEPAIGSGTFLTGNTGNANTADLQLNVKLTPTQVGTGIQADVNVSRGVASRLDQVLTSIFDPVTGRMKTISDGFDAGIAQLDDQKAKENDIIAARTQSLQQQFARMEETLAKLQQAGGFVTQQAANLTKSN
jgi:flagellar hook-associated protein 2